MEVETTCKFNTAKIYQDDLLDYLSANGLINLNPRYALLRYDIKKMDNAINRFKNTKQFLDACPILTISTNTLFYHGHAIDKMDVTMINAPAAIEDEKLLSVYGNPYITYDTIVEKKLSHMRIFYNDVQLKMLDLSLISVELGLALTIADDRMIRYCQSNNLDGFIELQNTNNNAECFLNVKNDKGYCPVFRFLTIEPAEKKEKRRSPHLMTVDKLKTLSIIDLLNKDEYLTMEQFNAMQNVLYCKINALTDLQPEIKYNLLTQRIRLRDTDNKKQSLDLLFEDKSAFFNILLLNYVNTYDTCDLKVREINQQIDIIDEKYIPTLTGLEVYSFENIHHDLNKHYTFKNNIHSFYLSEQIFDYILPNMAEDLKIHSYILKNYHLFYLMDGYDRYTLLYIDTEIDNSVALHRFLLQLSYQIMDQIKTNYESTPKGKLRSNLMGPNLSKIPITFRFLEDKVLEQLKTMSLADAMNTIVSNENKTMQCASGVLVNAPKMNKTIVSNFNVNTLYHEIIHQKYQKPQKLYQDLLQDVLSYKNYPVIDLKFFKWFAKLNGENVEQFLESIYKDIYENYKYYLAGRISFDELYDYIKVQELIDYFENTARKLNINPFLLSAYSEIIKDVNYIDWGYNKVKTIEEFIKLLDKLKKSIILNKYMDTISSYYALNFENEDTKKFLTYMAELMYDYNVAAADSYISKMLTSLEFNWLQLYKVDQRHTSIVEEFQHVATNEEVLEYIYNYFDITLATETRNAALELLKNKNLLILFIDYLNGKIDKKNLETAVNMQHVTISKKPKEKKKKKRKNESEENEEENTEDI